MFWGLFAPSVWSSACKAQLELRTLHSMALPTYWLQYCPDPFSCFSKLRDSVWKQAMNATLFTQHVCEDPQKDPRVPFETQMLSCPLHEMLACTVLSSPCHFQFPLNPSFLDMQFESNLSCQHITWKDQNQQYVSQYFLTSVPYLWHSALSPLVPTEHI